MPESSPRRGLQPRTRSLTAATAAIRHGLNKFNPNDPPYQRARDIVAVMKVVLSTGRRVLHNHVFAGTVMAKIVDVGSHDIFREGYSDLPCPCWFKIQAADLLELIGLSSLTSAVFPVALSYAAQEVPMPGNKAPTLVPTLDDLRQHWAQYRKCMSNVRFQQTLEQHAAALVFSPREASQTTYDWHVGQVCLALWPGDGYSWWHDAKIVWISRFGRTGRIVYPQWNGWGWERTEHPVILNHLRVHDDTSHLMCAECEEHAIYCDRYGHVV